MLVLLPLTVFIECIRLQIFSIWRLKCELRGPER